MTDHAPDIIACIDRLVAANPHRETDAWQIKRRVAVSGSLSASVVSMQRLRLHGLSELLELEQARVKERDAWEQSESTRWHPCLNDYSDPRPHRGSARRAREIKTELEEARRDVVSLAPLNASGLPMEHRR